MPNSSSHATRLRLTNHQLFSFRSRNSSASSRPFTAQLAVTYSRQLQSPIQNLQFRVTSPKSPTYRGPFVEFASFSIGCPHILTDHESIEFWAKTFGVSLRIALCNHWDYRVLVVARVELVGRLGSSDLKVSS